MIAREGRQTLYTMGSNIIWRFIASFTGVYLKPIPGKATKYNDLTIILHYIVKGAHLSKASTYVL
jgi:hypothetical protein